MTKNDLPYLIGNFARILKMLLKISQNLFFMELWRHNDVIFGHFSHFLRIYHRFRLITSCKPYYMGETHTLSYRKINEEHNETIFKSQKLFFRKLWRHNDVILSVFVFSVVYKTAKFKVILWVSGFKNDTFLFYFFETNILRPKPAS